jgi:hypothetical protein
MGMGLYDLMGKQAVMADGKAIVRERVEKIDGVSRTWFEWLSRYSTMAKTLVVEIGYDTDPNNDRFRQSVVDAIYEDRRRRSQRRNHDDNQPSQNGTAEVLKLIVSMATINDTEVAK